MDRATGLAIDEDAHIRQSCGDILGTPIGSRAKRREYGGMHAELIDHPGNPANRMRLMSATIMALLRWEPRISITNVSITVDMDGHGSIDIESTRRTGPRSGAPLNMAIPLK